MQCRKWKCDVPRGPPHERFFHYDFTFNFLYQMPARFLFTPAYYWFLESQKISLWAYVDVSLKYTELSSYNGTFCRAGSLGNTRPNGRGRITGSEHSRPDVDFKHSVSQSARHIFPCKVWFDVLVSSTGMWVEICELTLIVSWAWLDTVILTQILLSHAGASVFEMEITEGLITSSLTLFPYAGIDGNRWQQ